MTKPAPIYRDSKGRFVSLPIEARWALHDIGAKPPIPILRNKVPYCDAIYRPVRKSWLDRALTWFTWNRSRA